MMIPIPMVQQPNSNHLAHTNHLTFSEDEDNPNNDYPDEESTEDEFSEDNWSNQGMNEPSLSTSFNDC